MDNQHLMAYEEITGMVMYLGHSQICHVDQRIARSYRVPVVGATTIVVDLCPKCGWLFLNHGWQELAQRQTDAYALMGTSPPALPPYPFPDFPYGKHVPPVAP